MNEIKCPHCGTVFIIEEADYASLVEQVRTAEFEKELHKRLAEAEKARHAEIKLVETKVAQQAQKAAAQEDAEIERLKNEIKGPAPRGSRNCEGRRGDPEDCCRERWPGHPRNSSLRAAEKRLPRIAGLLN